MASADMPRADQPAVPHHQDARSDDAVPRRIRVEPLYEGAPPGGRIGAARGPLGKAKEMLAHAEAEHKGAGQDAKKHAEAVREARTAQGYAEEARLIAERF